VLSRVKIDQNRAAGREMPEEEIRKIRDEILQKYQRESSAYFSTSRLWDDGIIDPVDTRRIIAMGIAMSLNKPYPDPKTGVYRM
jgi:3-methylcrotonyl-CoA carboxylase beta subunit